MARRLDIKPRRDLMTIPSLWRYEYLYAPKTIGLFSEAKIQGNAVEYQ
jgi:hypothetical protein